MQVIQSWENVKWLEEWCTDLFIFISFTWHLALYLAHRRHIMHVSLDECTITRCITVVPENDTCSGYIETDAKHRKLDFRRLCFLLVGFHPFESSQSNPWDICLCKIKKQREEKETFYLHLIFTWTSSSHHSNSESSSWVTVCYSPWSLIS